MSGSDEIDSLGWLLEDEAAGDKDARRELYFLAYTELAGARRETGQPVVVNFHDGRLLDWLIGELAQVGRKLPRQPGRPDTVDSDFRIALQVARLMKLDGKPKKVAVSAVARSNARNWQTVDRIYRRYCARANQWITNATNRR